MLEKDIENLIAKYPDEFFPGSGFKLIEQQYKFGRRSADIVFQDKLNRKIIVEVKKGVLSRDASGQVMEYYGLMKSENPDDFVELILCANIIPNERKRFLETVGIECKEVGYNLIYQIANKMNYEFIDSGKIENSKINIEFPVSDNIWIFQGNSEKYNIYKALNDVEVIKGFHWKVNQYKNEISKGNIGLIWLSGKEAGIYAIIEIISEPDYYYETEAEKKYWIDITGDEGEKYRAKMKLLQLIEPPVSRDLIKKTDGLQDLSIIKRPWAGTNFPVTIDEWNLIKKMI